MVDYVREESSHGATVIRLDRLTNGMAMCSLCFQFVRIDELVPDPDMPDVITDVCRVCVRHIELLHVLDTM